MNESPAPTVSATWSTRAGASAELAGGAHAVGDAVAATGDDDEPGTQPSPRGHDLGKGLAGIQPVDVVLAGLDDVAQGDELLDPDADLVDRAHDRGADVGVVGDRRVLAGVGERSG